MCSLCALCALSLCSLWFARCVTGSTERRTKSKSMRMLASSDEALLRELAPQVLGAVVRRYGTFPAAEDAVQEALLAAAMQWPGSGKPTNPKAWLIQVAARRMTDL